MIKLFNVSFEFVNKTDERTYLTFTDRDTNIKYPIDFKNEIDVPAYFLFQEDCDDWLFPLSYGIFQGDFTLDNLNIYTAVARFISTFKSSMAFLDTDTVFSIPFDTAITDDMINAFKNYFGDFVKTFIDDIETPLPFKNN